MTKVTYNYHPLWKVLNGGKAYEPLWYQVQHLHSKVDEGFSRIICRWGRRAGKSTAVVAEIAREVTRAKETVLDIEHSPIVYVGGPNAESAARVWDPVWAAFVPPDDGSYMPPLAFLHESHDKQRGLITIKGGAKIYKKTGESPVSWQGERVTLIVMDEAHDMPEDVWENCMPALLDSGGRLIAIGVAKGKGRFRSYWHRGQGSDPNFYSSAVPTTANPIIRMRAEAEGKDVLQYLRDSAEGDLTDDEFARQYLAEEREEEGQVFSKFEQYFTGVRAPDLADSPELFTEYIQMNPGPYIMGLDLGKMHDFTVAYVGNVSTQKFVASMRTNKIDYMDQVPKIASLYKAFGCRFIHMDTNGPGEAVSEMLRAEGCKVYPFPWSNTAKQALISVMVREVERGHITFLEDDENLKKEMGLFEGSVSPGGVIKYEAPRGYFDDAVIAAALTIQKMHRNKTMAQNPIHKPYVKFKSMKQRSFMPPLPKPKVAVA